MVFKQFSLGYGKEIREFGFRIGHHFHSDQLVESLSLD